MMDAYEIADEIIKHADQSGKLIDNVFSDVERALDMLKQHDAEEAAIEAAPRPRAPVKRSVGNCPCVCSSGGFCGGCGHAGCGRR